MWEEDNTYKITSTGTPLRWFCSREWSKSDLNNPASIYLCPVIDFSLQKACGRTSVRTNE